MRYVNRTRKKPNPLRRASLPTGSSRYRRQVFLAICDYCAEHGGNPPTLREIMELVGITSTSVANYNVRQLIDMGLLEIKDRKLCVVGATWIPPKLEWGE